MLLVKVTIIEPFHSYPATVLVYHFSCVIPIHYGPNHKGNIFSIITHSSDACLHKQKMCSYRKAGGCGGSLDMQDQQRSVWDSMTRSGVSMQTTEELRRGWGQQWWPERGGLIKERVSDHASSVCLSGPVKVESPTGTSEGQLFAGA